MENRIPIDVKLEERATVEAPASDSLRLGPIRLLERFKKDSVRLVVAVTIPLKAGSVRRLDSTVG